MPNEKNRFTCHYPDCDKPATRTLTYFVDAPTIASLDPKQEVFCAEHAEAEMLDQQKPGLFTQTGWDGTKMDCTVNELTNSPLEDDCRDELTKTTVEDL
jgi:hypothetical protein